MKEIKFFLLIRVKNRLFSRQLMAETAFKFMAVVLTGSFGQM